MEESSSQENQEVNASEPTFNPDNCFYSMPLWKLFLFSIITFGLYDLVWFYKLWKVANNHSKFEVSPFWRTYFCLITNFKLFDMINIYIYQHNSKYTFAPNLWAIVYLGFAFMLGLPEDYSLMALLGVAPLLVIQNKINKFNEQFYPNPPVHKWSRKDLPFIIVFVISIIWSLL